MNTDQEKTFLREELQRIATKYGELKMLVFQHIQNPHPETTEQVEQYQRILDAIKKNLGES